MVTCSDRDHHAKGSSPTVINECVYNVQYIRLCFSGCRHVLIACYVMLCYVNVLLEFASCDTYHKCDSITYSTVTIISLNPLPRHLFISDILLP